MNLHSVVSGIIGAVNPLIPIGIQVSVGQTTAADGTQTGLYATPGSFTASIGGQFTAFAGGAILTVTSVLFGSLQEGDAVAGSDGVDSLPTDATILSQLTGAAGGTGTYLLSDPPASGTLTPCTVASASTVLNISAVAAGAPGTGQTLADATGALLPGTLITGQLSGTAGQVGLYSVGRQQTVAPEAMTTSTTLLGQIQPIGWRDIQQLDGLTLGGVRWKVYLNGEIDGVVRPELKGGDLITVPQGSRHAGTWLVAQVLEQWPDWVCAAITLQNGS